jgi:prepilin-type N-terminal cleavage/methylation domain-containing protein
MRTIAHPTRGFTLTELLVVILIVAALLAMVVPVGKSLREGNAALSCQTQMQSIGVALKAYFMDEQGFPPLAVAVDGSGEALPDAEIDAEMWPGLLILYDTGYMGHKDSFHCPRAVDVTKDSDEFYRSYCDKDPEAKVDYEGNDMPINRYKYMPHRWVTDELFDDYRRQLDTDPGDTVEIDGQDYKIVGPCGGTLPADTTVVTWCDAHYGSYTRGDQGQFLWEK